MNNCSFTNYIFFSRFCCLIHYKGVIWQMLFHVLNHSIGDHNSFNSQQIWQTDIHAGQQLIHNLNCVKHVCVARVQPLMLQRWRTGESQQLPAARIWLWTSLPRYKYCIGLLNIFLTHLFLSWHFTSIWPSPSLPSHHTHFVILFLTELCSGCLLISWIWGVF